MSGFLPTASQVENTIKNILYEQKKYIEKEREKLAWWQHFSIDGSDKINWDDIFKHLQVKNTIVLSTPNSKNKNFNKYSIFGIEININTTFCGLQRKGGSALNPASYGLFYFDGLEVGYINRQEPKNLEKLLAKENLPLNKLDLDLVITVFMEIVHPPTFCPWKTKNRYLIKGLESLQIFPIDRFVFADYGKDVKWEKITHKDEEYDVYKLNKKELKKYLKLLVDPLIIWDDDLGWILEFCTLYGNILDPQILSRICINILPDFTFTIQEKLLSKKVFSEVPWYMVD